MRRRRRGGERNELRLRVCERRGLGGLTGLVLCSLLLVCRISKQDLDGVYARD